MVNLGRIGKSASKAWARKVGCGKPVIRRKEDPGRVNNPEGSKQRAKRS